MKKILLVTDGGLPLPAIDGGAVETLINDYLDLNEKTDDFKFDVFSCYSKNLKKIKLCNYNNSNFYYINTSTIKYKFYKCINGILRKIFKFNINHCFANLVLKQCNKNEYDLVLIENSPSLVNSFYKRYGNKIILHLHNDFLNKNTLFGEKIIDNCKKILTVSEFVKNKVDEIKPNGKTLVIYNGIDLKKFDYKKINIDKRKRLIEKYNISENDFLILFTGRVCDDKGVKELLLAFSKIQAKYNNVKLLIVGGSFYSNYKTDGYIRELKKIAKNFEEKIIFTGYIEHNDMPMIYSLGNILVLPSKFDDPCPLTILEGMAMGLPIIASNCGGIPEEVNEKNSILLDRNNLINDIYDSIEILIKKQIDINQMKKESILLSKKFDVIDYSKNMLDILK